METPTEQQFQASRLPIRRMAPGTGQNVSTLSLLLLKRHKFNFRGIVYPFNNNKTIISRRSNFEKKSHASFLRADDIVPKCRVSK